MLSSKQKWRRNQEDNVYDNLNNQLTTNPKLDSLRSCIITDNVDKSRQMLEFWEYWTRGSLNHDPIEEIVR